MSYCVYLALIFVCYEFDKDACLIFCLILFHSSKLFFTIGVIISSIYKYLRAVLSIIKGFKSFAVSLLLAEVVAEFSLSIVA